MLDTVFTRLVDEAEVIAIVGLLSAQEIERMRIAQARVLRWIKGAERPPILSYIAEGSWVADLSGRDLGDTALIFLESVSAKDLEDSGDLRNRPHMRQAPEHMAGKRLWRIARDGHGWMPCRYVASEYHAIVWRTEISAMHSLPHLPAPKPWRELADAVPLTQLVDAILVRLGQRP